MYTRKPRPRQTKLWCDVCGKKLTDFELMLGCLVCTGKGIKNKVIDHGTHKKMMANKAFIALYAYEQKISIAELRGKVARQDMEFYSPMYFRFKELEETRKGLQK